MIVELIGTPGSGKTTMIPVIANLFSEHAYLARTIVKAARPVVSRTFSGRIVSKIFPPSLRDPLLWQLFYYQSYISRNQFSKEHPELVSFVRKWQFSREISTEEIEHNLYWWFHLTGYYQFLKHRLLPREVLLLDEGFIHRVVQLNASDHETLDIDRLNKYINLVPRPDLVVFVKAPADECEKRVFERGLWTRFQHKSRQQVSQYISNSHLVVNTAIDIINEMDWEVVEIDNSVNGITPTEHELELKLQHSSIRL